MVTLTYSPTADIARFVVAEGEVHYTENADPGARQYDRGIDYAADGTILAYEFMNATKRGINLDGLPHREQLANFIERITTFRVVQTAR